MGRDLLRIGPVLPRASGLPLWPVGVASVCRIIPDLPFMDDLQATAHCQPLSSGGSRGVSGVNPPPLEVFLA